MIVTIYWLEPDDGNWTFDVPDLTEQELQDVRTWSKKEAGKEWGVTIPSIRLTPGKHWTSINIDEFATAIRYNTEEHIYKTDCAVFVKHGIVRS
jgi:predicted NUDIX family NTP pyrophosphohydrolase